MIFQLIDYDVVPETIQLVPMTCIIFCFTSFKTSIRVKLYQISVGPRGFLKFGLAGYIGGDNIEAS